MQRKMLEKVQEDNLTDFLHSVDKHFIFISYVIK